jgi:transposase
MIYKWMDRFDEEGPAGLYDRDREGRPRKIDEEAEEEIQRLLEGNPTEEGHNATRWTAPRIAEHLQRELDIDVHEGTVRDALRRMEYSWTRPRRTLRPDPNFAERMRQIDEAIATAGPETTLLFEDETILKRFPPLRRQWQPVGEQRSVGVPEANEDFSLYGALNITSGETITRAFEKGRSDYTIQFLEEIKARTAGEVLLFWDQATWHTSKKVSRWLEANDRIQTMLLPKRAPRVNPMEDLWRELKEQVAACLERSLGALLSSCRRYFETLSSRQALSTAGIGWD